MLKKIFYLSTILYLTSCASIAKYNTSVTKLHPIVDLHEDIDVAYTKLQKLHPDLYWYISKDSLDFKFSELKKSINKPLSSVDLYLKIAPVISSIKQGHTSINPPFTKQTKKEIKLKGRPKTVFKSLKLKAIDNRLFILKTYKQNKDILEGTEILSLNNQSVSSLMNDFKKRYTSDGYNTTFLARIVGIAFGSFYTKANGFQSKITAVLKYKDSIYTRILYANLKKKEIQDKKNIRRIKIEKEEKLTKEERKIVKVNRKKRLEWEWSHGYDKYTEESNRAFKFIGKDSIAYLKIKSFTKGSYDSFYEATFRKIDSAKSKALILDLRDNLGGRLLEINELYSYLSKGEYQMVERGKMTSSFSNLHPFWNASLASKIILIIASPFVATYQITAVKRKKGVPYFNFSSSKKQDPKPMRFKGDIYVLINGTSFSASSILATHLKATKRATFIGEETGGAYNGTIAGLFTKIELPNSKLKLRMGLMKVKTPYKHKIKGHGVKPDIYKMNSIKDLIDKKDSVLEYTLTKIK